VIDIEKSSVIPFVFTSGGMAPECTKVAEKIAEKCSEPYGSVTTCVRTKLRFALF